MLYHLFHYNLIVITFQHKDNHNIYKPYKKSKTALFKTILDSFYSFENRCINQKNDLSHLQISLITIILLLNFNSFSEVHSPFTCKSRILVMYNKMDLI